MVAVATGKRDAIFFAIGVLFGSLVFGDLLFPIIEKFYNSTALGKFTLPQWLNLNPGIIALILIVVAIGAFWLAEKTERDFNIYK